MRGPYREASVNYHYRCGYKHIIMMMVMHNDATGRSKHGAGTDHEN